MKKLFFWILILGVFLSCNTHKENKWWFLQTGDIVFQESLYPNHQIMGLLSKNSINHCGIVLEKDQRYYVIEVLNGVQKTPMDDWVLRGKNREYLALRLREHPENKERLTIELLKVLNHPTDSLFSWTDDAYYNAELVYKIYERAFDIQLGKFRVILTPTLPEEVQQQMGKYRYLLPPKVEFIAPIDILSDSKLELIANTFREIKY